MVMSTITVAGINPGLNILGATQQLNFSQNLSTLQLNNSFIPLSLLPSQTNFEMRNNLLSGFRLSHLTTSSDTFGSLTLQSFLNGSSSGTDILEFASGVIGIHSNLDLNSHKVINSLDPVDAQDLATKNYIDTRTITLGGAVTGSGVLGSTITTTLTPIIVSQITDYVSATNALIAAATILPSKLSGYPSNTTTFLRGDGTWTGVTTSQVTDYTSATNALIAAATILPSKLSGYPADAAVFLRGDGTWTAPATKAFCSILMIGNATSTSTVGSFVKVAGTTTTVLYNLFSSSSSPANRMIYTGTPAVNLVVQVNLNAFHDKVAPCDLSFTIFKNGSSISTYCAPVSSTVINGETQAFGINAIIPMATNDYLEIFTNSSVNPTAVTVSNLNFTSTAL